MNKKDSASKRSVPSPKAVSLRESLNLSKQPGFGEPEPVSTVSPKLARGGKGKGGVATKTGYDVKTKVRVGGKPGKKK